MTTNSDDNAFPDEISFGLTKREYFAAMAMQGICGDKEFNGSVTETAVNLADELIEELNK